MNFTVREFASLTELNRESADCLSGYFRASGAGPHAVMLSGGRTPLAVYDELCRRGIKAGPDLTLFFSDERDVGEDSPDSNYGNTKPFLKSLGISPNRIIRVRTELGWRESAVRYGREIEAFLTAGGRITLGLLGLGSDGHTASLFTPEDIVRSGGLYAAAIPRTQKPDRISVTPGLLRRVERMIILAPGPDKRDIISKLVHHPEQVVAGMALKELPSVEIWSVISPSAPA